jgi:hypothetical protein
VTLPPERLGEANRRAGVAEVCWRDRGGRPQAAAGVPLDLDGRPVLALLWSQQEQARELADAPVVAWVISDRRLAQRAWEPLVGFGHFALIEDAEGALFCDRLLEQELRKHAPSRAYADSTLLRREHWWYLPRLVLVLHPREVAVVGERLHREQALLVVVPDGTAPPAGADGPERVGELVVDTVAVQDWDGAPRARSLSGRPLPPGDALLFGHDFSVPDLERWVRHATTGRWDGERLDVVSRPERRSLPPPPGLLERYRRHRSLERSCRAALRGVTGLC